ncbi:hypothetical protein KNV00_gp231 [Streptomyces phage Bmoc]|uniref:Uncharacterized protein n=1 Tax=Streptomyces phage Bmoc TaxID=2725629 RepID=A0A6M3T083_9CAUD|nr:hypothetical protein KNV00_gp231 [Streptomyces phage Bmoc]QJD50788.1 hypothetical protein SEA_BMOC_39 [Streptomyces phage Bmoc]
MLYELCYDYISWLSYASTTVDLTHGVGCAILNGEQDVAATNIVGYSFEMPREELRPLGAFSFAQKSERQSKGSPRVLPSSAVTASDFDSGGCVRPAFSKRDYIN